MEIGILLDAKLCGTQTREGEYLNMSNSTQLHMKNLPVSNLDVKLILARADVWFDQTKPERVLTKAQFMQCQWLFP